MLVVDATTPSHVLMDGDQCLGPPLMPFDSGRACAAIYGFSGKAAYDTFSAASPLALTPYPLVKGYLRNQINEAGEGLKLIAIDAVGPLVPTLNAAPLQCVLDAMEEKTRHVNAGYLLVFNEEASAYRIATMPSGLAASDNKAEPAKLN